MNLNEIINNVISEYLFERVLTELPGIAYFVNDNESNAINFDKNNYIYLTIVYNYALKLANGNPNKILKLYIYAKKLLDLRSLGVGKFDKNIFYKKVGHYFPDELSNKLPNSISEIIRSDYDKQLKKYFEDYY